MIIGLLSIVSEREILILRSVFNIIFFTSVVTFSLSVYALGGFDNSEIVHLIQGEKKARYILTVLHVKISFILLLLGIFIAALFSIPYGEDQETYRFALYAPCNTYNCNRVYRNYNFIIPAHDASANHRENGPIY